MIVRNQKLFRCGMMVIRLDWCLVLILDSNRWIANINRYLHPRLGLKMTKVGLEVKSSIINNKNTNKLIRNISRVIIDDDNYI